MLIQADTLIFSDFIRMVNFKVIHKYILYYSVETVATHTLITSPFFFLPMKTHINMHVPILCSCVLVWMLQWNVEILALEVTT